VECQSKLFGADPSYRRHPGCTDPGPLRGRLGEVALTTGGACAVRRRGHGDLSLNIHADDSRQRGHGRATWGVRAESGLGRSSPRHARRGGADGTERRTSAPGSDLLGQPPAERRCAARKQRRAGGQPPVGRAGITVRSAVVLRNRGGCRSRQATTLFCPRRANPLTSRQRSDPGRTKGDCASGDLKAVLDGEEGSGICRWKALRSVEAVTLDGAAGKAFLASRDGPPRAGRNGW
jgi:hypothetical protein